MKKILFSIFRLYQTVRTLICTWIFKKMIKSYGEKLGVNGLSISSSKANVIVGNHVNFNGVRIIGLGGGKDWRLLPLRF